MTNLDKTLCWVFGHKYRSAGFYSFMTSWEKAYCKRCGAKFVINHQVREILSWDIELDRCGNGDMP